MSAEDKSKAHFKKTSPTPEYLGLDENPFDRFPFSPLLEQIADGHKLDLGTVSGSLTFLSRVHLKDAIRNDVLEPQSAGLADEMQAVDFKYRHLADNLRTYLKSQRLPVAEQRRYVAVMGEVAESLTQTGAVHWAEYLAEEMNSGIYRNDGVRSISPTVRHLTIRTYEAYSANRSRRQEAAGMVGLGEALPAGFPSESLGFPNVRGDRTRRQQQWAIVQATETNRVNRKKLNTPPGEPAT